MVCLKSYCKVIIPAINLDSLDYMADNMHIKVGQVVSVPFKNKKKVGLIVDTCLETKLEASKIKAIDKIIEGVEFDRKFVKFLFKAAQYYYQSINSFIKLAIPSDDLFDNYRSKKIPDDCGIPGLAILSENQQKAYEFIQHKYNENKYGVVVLEGVTGSGKTEVYLNVIADHLITKSTNKQVLILLPEIALTKQLIDKIRKRFALEPAVWHSSTTKSEKKRIYQGVVDGSIKLVIGARSSLFLPYKELGMIVVDEEHDGSYKQEEQVIYNARDMAVYRAFHQEFLVVLASATPSIETIQNINDGKYEHVRLPGRYGNQSLPQFVIIDMKQQLLPHNSWISNSLKEQITKTIAAGKQVLLYLNRRGYAPLMICAACGYKPICQNCATWLVEHRSDNKLKCHHCNYSKINHGRCPSCKTEGVMKSCGPGVERIAEEVVKLFPQEKLTIMTRDTMSSADKIEQTIASILHNEISIIIGTQMVAKGHHFPNLTLVGIIDADIGFGGADLRATEKTYQLLEQVSGRSGRESPGIVAIQTYNTDSKLLGYIVKNDREKFVEEEINLRKHFKLPPFSRLAHILVTAKKEEVTKSFAQKLSRLAPPVSGVVIYGPIASYFARLKDKYRYQIVIKCDKHFDLHKYLDLWLTAQPIPRHINLKIDIDPYNFT